MVRLREHRLEPPTTMPGSYSRAVDTDRVRRAYGAVADLYIGMFGSSAQVDPEDLAFIGRHLAGRPGRVLDLGCGPGHLTGYLHALGADVTGVDLVPEFIDHARHAHPGVPFRLGSMDDLEPAGGILAWYSLIHRPPEELDDVLAGFRRALAPGGTLVVGFCDGTEVAPFDHRVTTAYYWPVDEMSRRLDGVGLTEVERLQRPADGTHRALAALAAR
jgi:SAM-dependent methyltransferase